MIGVLEKAVLLAAMLFMGALALPTLVCLSAAAAVWEASGWLIRRMDQWRRGRCGDTQNRLP